jgi:hypothetical protein
MWSQQPSQIDPMLGILPSLVQVKNASFSPQEKSAWLMRAVFAAAFAYIAFRNKQKVSKNQELTGLSQYVGSNPALAAAAYLSFDLAIDNYFISKKLVENR